MPEARVALGSDTLRVMSRLSVIATFVLCASAAATNPPAFAKDLGIAFTDVEFVDVRLGSDARASIARSVGVPLAVVDSLRIATAMMPSDEGPRSVVLVHAPLAAPLATCRFVGAFSADGAVVGSSLWGKPEFDEDPTLAWSMYLHTLREATEDNGVAATPPEEVAEAAATFDDVVVFRLEQSRVMQQNVLLERQLKVLGRQGKPIPDPKPAGVVAAGLRKLLEHDEPLREILGESGAKRYAAHAEVTARALDRLASIDPKLEDAAKRMRSAWDSAKCSACHTDRAPALDGKFRRTLNAERRALPVPFGVLRIGHDLAPVPHDTEGAWSQAVANGFRAARLAVLAIAE